MQSSYSLQEPYAREISDCPSSLSKIASCHMMLNHHRWDFLISWKFHLFTFIETLLEHLITKDSFKTSLPTFDKIKTHAFFRDYASTFEQKHVELNSTIVKQNVSFDANAKDFITKLSQKSEQRLKDEQKLVREWTLNVLLSVLPVTHQLFNYLISPHRSRVRSEVWHLRIRNISTRKRSAKIKRG